MPHLFEKSVSAAVRARHGIAHAARANDYSVEFFLAVAAHNGKAAVGRDYALYIDVGH